MPVRVPLFACFVALLVLAVGSIATLVGVLDSLLADEARRSAVASVNGALDHAVELVAEPFRDVVLLTRRMAELSRQRNDRCDDGRTTGAQFKPLQQEYLATVSGARSVPIFSIYQVFRVNMPRGISICGCVPGVHCLFYASSAMQYTPATWPNFSSAIIQTNPRGWNGEGTPSADRAVEFQKGSTLSETGTWGSPELFVYPTSGETIMYITFQIPIFFDPVTNLSVVTEAISLLAGGFEAVLKNVRLPRTRVVLIHRQSDTILAATFPGVPLFNDTKSTATTGGGISPVTSKLWFSTNTPSSELNDAVSKVKSENHGSLRLPQSAVHVDGGDNVIGAATFTFGTLQLTIVTSTDRGYFFDTLVKARTIGISVAVGCALLCVVLSVLVSVLVQRGISKLQAAMGPASRLECDPEQYAAEGTSVILDIARLQEAFGVMNTNLHVAGEYLPQSVKAAWAATMDEEGGEEEDEDDQCDTARTQSGTHSSVHGSADQDSAVFDRSSRSSPNVTSPNRAPLDRKLSGSVVSASPNPGRKHTLDATEKLVAASQRKTVRIAVLCLNLVGFKRLLHIMSEADLVTVSANLTTLILAAVKAHKGVVDTFQGDRYTVTFNAVVPCAAPARQAAATALAVSSAVADHDVLSRCLVSSGVAYGPASVGDIGCAAMRRFGVLGDVVAQATVLERLCRSYIVASSALVPHGSFKASASQRKSRGADVQAHIVCVVAQNTAQDLRVHFDLVGVDCVRLPGAAAATVLSAVVSQRREDKEDEWLYVVGDSDGVDVSTRAFAAALRGDTENAEQLTVPVAPIFQSASKVAATTTTGPTSATPPSVPTSNTTGTGCAGEAVDGPCQAPTLVVAMEVARENLRQMLHGASGTTTGGRSLGPFYDGGLLSSAEPAVF